MSTNFSFKKAAEEATTLCPLMAGREKLSTEDVVNQELTIIGFDFAPKFDKEGKVIIDDNGEVDTYGVVVFEEIPDHYYCVGTVFTKVCHVWAEPFESPEEASIALKAEGGVRVKFSEGKTKSGNNLVSAQIL